MAITNLDLQTLIDLARRVPENPAADDPFAIAFLRGCRLRQVLKEDDFLLAVRRESPLALALKRCEELMASRSKELLRRASIQQ
jgi:hypothetical protein